jgi:hypothetical protein
VKSERARYCAMGHMEPTCVAASWPNAARLYRI